MTRDGVGRERYLPWIFLLAGALMIVAGIAQLVVTPETALLGWVVIACGVFNLVVAALYLRRPAR